ncbi:hypothetical protein ACIGMX_34995 [Streptomyces aquilus]|uniref:hypothetical protein n=1 Tax=Streptomyces aquilus TaxID=2548456 RepID=UPI0037D3B5D1
MSTVVYSTSGRPRLRIARLVQLLVARQRLAGLDELRERLPLGDPDRHALDVDIDRRFAELAASYTPLADGAANEGRRAALWQAIQKEGGRWKSGRALRLYRSLGYCRIGKSTASHDLKVLRAAGHLVQHDEDGVRYFTLDGGSDA